MEPLRYSGTRTNKFESALARNRLRKIIKELSFSTGEIGLASGKASNYYFDMKPTMFNPEGQTLLVELILERLEGVKVDYVGGLAMGAIPLVSSLMLRAAQKDREVLGFFVRKDVKDHGTRKRIEGIAESALKGKSVVILEDVTTTGASANIAIEAAQAAGATITLILSIVDREEGAAEFFGKKGIPFDHLFTTSAILAD